MYDHIASRFNEIVSQSISWALVALPNAVAAILILIFGFWIAARAKRAVIRVLDSGSHIDSTLTPIMGSAVRYAILVLVLVVALGQLGIQTTTIIAALGAAGLAIGLALQGTLSNIAAGLMLLWLRPFGKGDYIDAQGVSGTVIEIGLFSTEMHSWDGLYQFVPNSQLWNKHLTNYSRLPSRLVDLTFGVGYSDDLELAKTTLLDIARADKRVHDDPEPYAYIDALGDSAVNVRIRAQTNTADYWSVRRYLTEEGKLRLEKAGLSIPFPQRDVHLIDVPESVGQKPV